MVKTYRETSNRLPHTHKLTRIPSKQQLGYSQFLRSAMNVYEWMVLPCMTMQGPELASAQAPGIVIGC